MIQDPATEHLSFSPQYGISPIDFPDPNVDLSDTSGNLTAVIASSTPDTAWSIGHDTTKKRRRLGDQDGLNHLMVNKDEFEELANQYFIKIDAVFKFFDHESIMTAARARLDSSSWWTETDVVLNGIAVLGLIISRNDTTSTRISRLLECLRLGLLKRIPRCLRTEAHTMEDEAQSRCLGFVLYLLALRLSGATDRIWEARCEALDVFNRQSCSLRKDARVGSKTFIWHAAYAAMKILNAEICFDFGQPRDDGKLSRVLGRLPNDTKHPLLPFLECMTALEGTTALKCMASPASLKSTEGARPSKRQRPSTGSRHEWEAQRLVAAMKRIELLQSDTLFLHLFKASNVMLIMEKLLSDESGLATQDDVIQEVIDTGVAVCRKVNVVTVGEVPWWDLARLPYRFLMILLALNRANSLAQAAPTFGAIARVTKLFPSVATKDMLKTAASHINLWHDLSRMHCSKTNVGNLPRLIPGWDLKTQSVDLLSNQDSLAAWTSKSWLQHLNSSQRFIAQPASPLHMHPRMLFS